MPRRSLFITYIATYLLAVGFIIRIFLHVQGEGLFTISVLLVAYLVLLFSEPLFIRQKRRLTYIYLFSQTAIIITLSTYISEVDFWAALFSPIVVQVMHGFPQRIGYLITGIFTLVMSIFIVSGLGINYGLPLVLVYVIVYFMPAAFVDVIKEASSAREKLLNQQAELKVAHEQLKIYTTKAEKLAIVQERSRLARELHDSVTQSLHSSTLMAEAGQRLANSGDIERARGYLIRIGEISQQALREMRLLVYQLRPSELRGIGLETALKQRLDAVERRSGVEGLLSIEDGLAIPANIEEDFFRIAMEALNNALKHANPTKVKVSLHKEMKHQQQCFEFSIVDDGKGFDPNAKEDEGGLGLISMKERVKKLGGEITIISSTGEGTEVKVCLNLETIPNSIDSEKE